VQSVGVTPVGTDSNDPNAGQWFVGAGGPGSEIRMVAHIANPADVDQTVRLSVADVIFDKKGAPQLHDKDVKDIGTWVRIDNPDVTIPAKKAMDVSFTVVVPKGAEPGDHVGALIVEGAPQSQGDGNLFKIIKRVATRLYVTVPGEARPAFVIDSVEVNPDSSFFPRAATVTVTVHNTGRVRLRPTVKVNGSTAAGPSEVLSQSVEKYVISKSVPLWGGPRRYAVSVETLIGATGSDAGPVQTARASRFYFPWALLIALVAALAAIWFLRRAWSRRGGKYAEMRADMKRIERLLAEQRAGGVIESRDDDPEVAIKSAIKRAGRAGDKDAEEKLKEKLAEHRAAHAAAPREEAPLLAEPAPAAAPEPTHEPEPAPAVVASDAYDFLREEAAAAQTAAEPDPKDFYDSLRADSPTIPPAAPEPPRVPVQGAMGPGYFVPDPISAADAPDPEQQHVVASAPEHTAFEQDIAADSGPGAAQPAVVANGADDAPAAPGPGRDETLVVLLRELSSAPKRRQEALIKAARSYGVLTLRSHADLVEQLPADVRAKLLPKQVI
jgi:hypothetical protein